MSEPLDPNSIDSSGMAPEDASLSPPRNGQSVNNGQSAKEASPIESIELPPPQDASKEGRWLKATLHKWLDEEFLPEIVNEHIAARASQVFVRQRMEGENNLNALVLAVLTEMQGYDFSKSFYSEFAVANAVGDLLLDSLGIERCCGN